MMRTQRGTAAELGLAFIGTKREKGKGKRAKSKKQNSKHTKQKTEQQAKAKSKAGLEVVIRTNNPSPS